MQKYLDQIDAQYAGRTPRQDPDDVTVKELGNMVLNAENDLVISGELTQWTSNDNQTAANQIIDQFGKGSIVANLIPSDFSELST